MIPINLSPFPNVTMPDFKNINLKELKIGYGVTSIEQDTGRCTVEVYVNSNDKDTIAIFSSSFPDLVVVGAI